MGAAASSIEPLAALEGEAHLWIVRTESLADPERRASLRRLLSEDEHARLARRVRESDRHTFLIARALVRTVLAHYTGEAPAELRFETGRFGRPSLAFPCVDALRFSLTHTEGLVACLVGRGGEFGIDAEALDRRGDFERIAGRVLADSECRAWSALPEAERRAGFLRHWTLKEAYLKALGVGLQVAPRSAVFAIDGERIRLETAAPHDSAPESWRFVGLRPTAEHTLAVALRRIGAPSPTLVVREGMPELPNAAATARRAARRAG